MKTPREILEDYKRRDLPLDQAEKDIIAWHESKVPKKLKGHTFTTMKHIPDDSIIWTGYRQGYNQCVDNFHKEG